MAYIPPALERPASIILDYYYDVADEVFTSLPDSGRISTDGKTTLARHYLPGVVLTTIATGETRSRYLRFKGLARQIGRAELAKLGVHPHEPYEDLVIACSGHASDPVWIVPSEVRHHVRKLGHVQSTFGGGLPIRYGQADPWVVLWPSKFGDEIYTVTDGHIVDMRGQLPQTIEACMSVAGLLAVRDPAIADLLDDSV